MKRPTDDEISHQENEAGSDSADGLDKFPAMTYADGVSAALRWVLGSEETAPYDE